MKMLPTFVGAALSVLLGVGLGINVFPSEGHAYCLLPTTGYLSALSSPIPVYVNHSGVGTSAGFIGLTDSPGSCSANETIACSDSLALVVQWTKAAIDEWNMASHGGPKLYYAGFDSPVSAAWVWYPTGIIIESFQTCAAQNSIQPPDPRSAYFAITVANAQQKAKIQIVRGGPKACDGPDDHEPLKEYYWWVDPGDDDGNKTTNHDLVAALIHEFGHALGLNHPDTVTVGTPGLCAGGVKFVAEASVMHPSNKDFRRRLRGDDILALRALYDKPERSLVAASNSTSGASAGSWSGQSVVGSVVVNTPPTVSDAARNDESNLQVAATNADDELFYLLGYSGGILANQAYVTSGAGTAGVRVRSYDPVAIARGRRVSDDALRVAVAWLGSPAAASGVETDDPSDPNNRIWWKVNKPGSGGWLAPQATGFTKYKELGLSYDPVRDLFLLVYIDTYPYPANLDLEVPGDAWVFARTIDAVTGDTECIQALTTAEQVLHVGSPACDVRGNDPTQCHIPVVTTNQTAPVLRVLEGTIDEHPVETGVYCWLRDVEPDPPPLTTTEKSYGPLWLAMDGATSNGVALMSHVPGLSTTSPSNLDYAEIFVMTRDNNGLLTGTISDALRIQSDYWPIAVGSLARTTSPNTVWWAVTAY